jgi:hypothetical protein
MAAAGAALDRPAEDDTLLNVSTIPHLLKGLRKTTKTLVKDNRCPGPNSKRTLSQYKSEVLPLNQNLSVIWYTSAARIKIPSRFNHSTTTI